MKFRAMPFRQIFREKIDKTFWPGTSREARDQALEWSGAYGLTLYLVTLTTHYSHKGAKIFFQLTFE